MVLHHTRKMASVFLLCALGAHASNAQACPAGATCVPYQGAPVYTWVGTGISAPSPTELNTLALSITSQITLPNSNRYTAYAFGAPIDATHWAYCSWTLQWFNGCGGTVAYTPGTCPANSTDNGTACTCDAGYQPDAAGTSCVSKCPIDDLPPITDPEVQLFEDGKIDIARLSPRMQAAHTCLMTAASAGAPKLDSGYRPVAYNQHLLDVWNKWAEFERAKNDPQITDNPSCISLESKVLEHFRKHRLLVKQPPVLNSRHTRGEAIDVSINLPAANIDALAAGCKDSLGNSLKRPLPVSDPVHFQFP